LSKNHDYIVYVNSFVDYKKYHSYGEVQQAIAQKEIFPDPPEYRPKYVCIFCGKEIIRISPFDSVEFCSASCAGKYAYRKKHGTRASKIKQPVIHRTPGPKPNKYRERIESIVPYYNEGLSDHDIGRVLGLSDKYIANLRKYFGVPANYGQPPENKIDCTLLIRQT
jgi:transposase-like protein